MAGKGKPRPFCSGPHGEPSEVTVGGQICARPPGKNGAVPKKKIRRKWFVGPPINKPCGGGLGHPKPCMHGTVWGDA